MIDDSEVVMSRAVSHVRLLPDDRGESCGKDHAAQRSTGASILVQTYSELKSLNDLRKDFHASHYPSKHNCMGIFSP